MPGERPENPGLVPVTAAPWAGRPYRSNAGAHPGSRPASHDVGDKGTFMRCSTDHHNVLALAAPVNFLHHTSWQVDDIDEVGRGASAMLAEHPERYVWGLGRHHAGSNFFWYLKDPADSFSEYYLELLNRGARGLESAAGPSIR
jgi:hypothetical protein